MANTAHNRTDRMASGAAAQATAPEHVTLACGHQALSQEPVVIRPTGKIKFHCPNGCGLQSAH